MMPLLTHPLPPVKVRRPAEPLPELEVVWSGSAALTSGEGWQQITGVRAAAPVPRKEHRTNWSMP